ncbi:MAG TPA: response regulator [Thermodesulfobacteriota bacterium]|nr:response regulator [Thermodesulfobacteriota bacterium]
MSETKQDKKIVAVLDDLFFSSKIREAAKSLDLNLEITKNTTGLIEKLESQKPSLLIFDLNCKVCSPLEIIENLKSSSALKDVPTLGYLSHVQTDLKEQATKAGCDLVLPRSKFSKDLREILTKYSTPGG